MAPSGGSKSCTPAGLIERLASCVGQPLGRPQPSAPRLRPSTPDFARPFGPALSLASCRGRSASCSTDPKARFTCRLTSWLPSTLRTSSLLPVAHSPSVILRRLATSPECVCAPSGPGFLSAVGDKFFRPLSPRRLNPVHGAVTLEPPCLGRPGPWRRSKRSWSDRTPSRIPQSFRLAPSRLASRPGVFPALTVEIRYQPPAVTPLKRPHLAVEKLCTNLWVSGAFAVHAWHGSVGKATLPTANA